MVSAYCGFVLMSLHLGIHWGMMMGMARRIVKEVFIAGRWMIRGIVALVDDSSYRGNLSFANCHIVAPALLFAAFQNLIFHLFHCPHLFNQGLFFLSANCPYGQDQLHSEQYQNEHAHFQNRELIRHYISGKSTYAHFSASKDGSGKPND